MLKAEILLWQTHNGEVLQLLSTPPPPELSNGEFAVRAKAAEGMALLTLSKDADDGGRLKEADELALKTAPQLRCEVVLFEGNQAFKKAHSFQGNGVLRKQQYAMAEKSFLESLRLAQHYDQTFIQAAALGSMGRISTILGRFDDSADWYSKALEFARSSHYRLAEHISLQNLAWNYKQLGDLEKAIFYFSEEEKIIDSLGQDQLKEAVFNNLGETYSALGKYSAARESYLKALAIAREMDRDKKSDLKRHIVAILNNLAETALDQAEVEEAENYNRQAAALSPVAPHTLLIAARIARARNHFAEAKSLLSKLSEDKGEGELDSEFVRWDAQDELAKIAASEHQSGRAENQFQKLVDAVESARSSLHAVENRLAFSSHAGRYYDDYVSFLVTSGQLKRAFQVAEFSRARTLEEGVGLKAPLHPGDIRIERIQAFLKQHDRIILAYWLAGDNSFLWLVSPAQLRLFTLAADREIEGQARDYNKMLQEAHNPAELESKGQSLYEMLLGQVEKLMPRDAKLVIIPDGALSKLNFETLRAPRPTPHYWIRDAQVEVASSTTLLLSSRSRKLAQKQKLLLIGDPIQASSDYPTLMHAAEELKRVEAHFSPNQETVISGKDAAPSVYQASHPANFALIHFVTHGTASELSPLESAIILSPQAENSFKLYARDVVKTPINADIVTISACYGAGKRAYSGEGLVGLAWAFLRAGAHQVVAGLWDVDDRAAVDLMDNFYTELQKTGSAATALRAAKLKMVTSDSTYSRPYYWAALQLYTGS